MIVTKCNDESASSSAYMLAFLLLFEKGNQTMRIKGRCKLVHIVPIILVILQKSCRRSVKRQHLQSVAIAVSWH
jgi:hypothetical protein